MKKDEFVICKKKFKEFSVSYEVNMKYKIKRIRYDHYTNCDWATIISDPNIVFDNYDFCLDKNVHVKPGENNITPIFDEFFYTLEEYRILKINSL